MEDPENLGSGMAGAGDNLVKQYPPATHQFLEVPFKTKVLILDEPTNHLSIKETNKVLGWVEGLKSQGITSVFITHNLHHVYPIADRLVVLSRGEKTAEMPKSETSIEALTDLIV